jgi:hypothetical protein
MKVLSVKYERLFSWGNHQNKKFGVEIQLEEGDDAQAAFDRARAEVHKANQRDSAEGMQVNAKKSAAAEGE